ncbi:MAG: DUF1232 domain-containing protein [Candidatus Marinimicrobia bacterium]|nr:DUF1232 domain-containing protein [Candidatus Neomarinimicrobiota bacterium]
MYLWTVMRGISRQRITAKLAAAFTDGKMVKETLYQVVAMYLMLKDPLVARTAKVQVAAALVYLLNPFDLMPDMLPMGLVDDIAVLGVVWKLIQGQISAGHRDEARRIVLQLLGRLNLTDEIPPGRSA